MKERTNQKPKWTARNIARRQSTAEFFEVEEGRVERGRAALAAWELLP
jgi:hypothetical protein